MTDTTSTPDTAAAGEPLPGFPQGGPAHGRPHGPADRPRQRRRGGPGRPGQGGPGGRGGGRGQRRAQQPNRPDPARRVEHWSTGEKIPPLTPPTADNGLRAVLQRRYLLKLLVRREVSARYQGSFLGLIWSYINPLTQFCIYFFIMGALFRLHTNIPNFAIHIFSAIIIVHFFTETLNAGTRSIVRNRSIVQKMSMPREMFPVASMLVSLYHVGPQLVILLVACVGGYGWTPDLYGIACFLVALVMVAVLGTATALLFSAANVFFRDVGSFVNILTQLLRFGVPMIYSYEMVDDRFGAAAPYYLYNPAAVAVLLFQRAFWTGTALDSHDLAATHMPDLLLLRGVAMIGVASVILVIGQVVFTRLETKIPERL